MADKERTLKVFEKKATPEQRAEGFEQRREEVEAIKEKINKAKESSKEQEGKDTERVEKSGGEPGDVEDAEDVAEVLNTKTEEAAGEGGMSATDLFEQAQAIEAEQKETKPTEVDRELRSTVDIVMEKYQSSEAPEEAKEIQTEGGKVETVGKGIEGEKLRKELDEARKVFALMEKNDPKYAEALKDYRAKKEAMQSVAHEAKRATLLKKGISEADTEIEMGKYAREVLVPNFAVAEAAKIQDEKADETMIEKVKDSKVSQFIYGAVDKYRKMPFSKKLVLSAGLFGGALVAGTAGGAIGAVIGGGVGIAKLTQRVLGGAGTAVGTEAFIQRSQQKWMGKEGWGKNRKEYVANEIQKLREGVKRGEIKAESLEEAGGLEEIEKALEERKDLENKFERRRTILAGIMGVAVGSGAALQAIKQYWEWIGAKNLIFGVPKEIPGVEKAREVASAVKEHAKAAIAPVQEKIIPIAVGVRGPEGALIDNFKAHPNVAKAFGWDGKADLSKWAGTEAHKLWTDDAKEALKNPKILAQMEKLGFTKDAEGYAKMAHRIGKGFIQVDPTSKHIKFTDIEYLKNTTKELQALIEPTATPKELPSVEVGEVGMGTETPAPLQGAQKILHDLVDQEKLSEMEEKMAAHIKELTDRLKENGLSPEEIMKYNDDISMNAVKLAGIDLSAAKEMVNIDALQKIMESSEGKLGGLLSKLPQIDQENLKSFIEETGGWDKFMDMPSTVLFPEDNVGPGPVDIGFTKLGYALKGLTGDAPMLHGTATIREVLESIESKEVFGGTAKELMEKIK